MQYKEIQLTDEQHDKFIKSFYGSDFLQLSGWAYVKKENWTSKKVAIEDQDKNVVGVALLLFRKVPMLSSTLCYIPHGLVVDFNNKEAFLALWSCVKKCAKEQNAFSIKMDPNIIYDENVVTLLKSQNFVYAGRGKGFLYSQPRFVVRTKIQQPEKLMKTFNANTRRYIKKSLQYNLKFIKEDEKALKDFSDLMIETGNRDNFAIRDYGYFLNLVRGLKGDVEIIEVRLQKALLQEELNKSLEDNKKESEKITSELDQIESPRKQKMAQTKLKELKSMDESIKKTLDEIKDAEENELLASCLLVYCSNTCNYVYAASSSHLRKTYPVYFMIYKIMEECNNRGIEYLDFGGVSGYTDREEDPEHYGLYEFKMNWGSEHVEKIGEFDYALKPMTYSIFTKVLPCVKKTFSNIKKMKDKKK